MHTHLLALLFYTFGTRANTQVPDLNGHLTRICLHSSGPAYKVFLSKKFFSRIYTKLEIPLVPLILNDEGDKIGSQEEHKPLQRKTRARNEPTNLQEKYS